MGGAIISSRPWKSPEGHQEEASFREQGLLRFLTHTKSPHLWEHYHGSTTAPLSLGVHILPV